MTREEIAFEYLKMDTRSAYAINKVHTSTDNETRQDLQQMIFDVFCEAFAFADDFLRYAEWTQKERDDLLPEDTTTSTEDMNWPMT